MRISSTTLLAGGLAVLPGTLACDLHLRARDGHHMPKRDLAPRADTSDVKRPQFGSVPYGVSVGSCTVPGKLALTIDDGFDKYSGALLDIFKKNNVKATFFLVGDNGGFERPLLGDAKGPFPGLMKRAIADGHQLASHSWSHQDFLQISAKEREEELLKLEGTFVDVLGYFPTYFRPPYTSYDGAVEKQLADLGYHNVNYDLDTLDWNVTVPEAKTIFTSAISKGASSYLALMHELKETSVNELAQFFIDEAKKGGYDLVTVGECLGDPPSNWYRDPATGGPVGAGTKPPTTSSSSSATKTSSTSKSDTKTSTPTGGSASTSTDTSTITSATRPPAQSTSPAPATTTTGPVLAGARGMDGLISMGAVLLSGLVLLAQL